MLVPCINFAALQQILANGGIVGILIIGRFGDPTKHNAPVISIVNQGMRCASCGWVFGCGGAHRDMEVEVAKNRSSTRSHLHDL